MTFYTQKIIHQTTQGIIEATLIDTENGIYRIDLPFSYTIEFMGKINFFHIDKGFYTNFATIPHRLKFFLNPINEGFLAASLIHDFILNEFEYLQFDLNRKILVAGKVEDVRNIFNWDSAADIFYEIMVQENSFTPVARKLIRSCVKAWARLDPKVKHRFIGR